MCFSLLPLCFLVTMALLEGGEADPKPISTASAEHYKWGQNCDGWHLVNTPALSVIEELMPPGTAEVAHYHEKSQQFFYVLQGAAVMELNGRKVRLNSGEGLHIPARTTHQIRNSSDQPLRIIVTSQPPSHGDKVEVKAK